MLDELSDSTIVQFRQTNALTNQPPVQLANHRKTYSQILAWVAPSQKQRPELIDKRAYRPISQFPLELSKTSCIELMDHVHLLSDPSHYQTEVPRDYAERVSAISFPPNDRSEGFGIIRDSA